MKLLNTDHSYLNYILRDKISRDLHKLGHVLRRPPQELIHISLPNAGLARIKGEVDQSRPGLIQPGNSKIRKYTISAS